MKEHHLGNEASVSRQTGRKREFFSSFEVHGIKVDADGR
jgi:hypothetical protein